jgi:UDP-glucose 4-epimerase
MKKTIMITGGLGYIGSHLTFRLLSSQYDIIVLDNKSNNYLDEIPGTITYIGDLSDTNLLQQIFNQHKIDCVIHLAAKKSVEESKTNSLEYYKENVSNTINLLQHSNCKNIVFASSASVYGDNDCCKTTSSVNPLSPYARTKVMCEQILSDLWTDEYNITILRIFNPIGYSFKGKQKGNNLLDKICDSIQSGNKLAVYNQGEDVRDYVYIEDLTLAIQESIDNKGFNIANVGSGIGTSTKEIINLFPEVQELIYYTSDNNPVKLVSGSEVKINKSLCEIVEGIRKVRGI